MTQVVTPAFARRPCRRPSSSVLASCVGRLGRSSSQAPSSPFAGRPWCSRRSSAARSALVASPSAPSWRCDLVLHDLAQVVAAAAAQLDELVDRARHLVAGELALRHEVGGDGARLRAAHLGELHRRSRGHASSRESAASDASSLRPPSRPEAFGIASLPTNSGRQIAAQSRGRRPRTAARIGHLLLAARCRPRPTSTSANGHPSAAANAPSVDGRSPTMTPLVPEAGAHELDHRRLAASPRPRARGPPRSRTAADDRRPRRAAVRRRPDRSGRGWSRRTARRRAPHRRRARSRFEVERAVPAHDDRVGRAARRPRRTRSASSASTTPGPAHASTARPAGSCCGDRAPPPPARCSNDVVAGRRRCRRPRAARRSRRRGRSSCSSGTRRAQPAAAQRARSPSAAPGIGASPRHSTPSRSQQTTSAVTASPAQRRRRARPGSRRCRVASRVACRRCPRAPARSPARRRHSPTPKCA